VADEQHLEATNDALYAGLNIDIVG